KPVQAQRLRQFGVDGEEGSVRPVQPVLIPITVCSLPAFFGEKRASSNCSIARFQGSYHSALSPVSPVLIRNTDSRSDTKILPSPTLPVFAARAMVSITRFAMLSATYSSIFTFGTKSVVYSAPR